jgi:mono/diheme cytochrome c family protein
VKRNAALALALALAAALALGLPAPTLRAADARSENWQTYCSVCHGDEGSGQTEEGRKHKARDLTNAKWQDTIDDNRIVRSITKGHDEMPAFGKKLSEDEIRALAKEVRSLAKKKSS